MNSNVFIKRIYSKKTVTKITNKINALGPSTKLTVNRYLNNKTLVLILLFFAIIYLSSIGYILAPIITVLIYFVYDYFFLDLQIKKRVSVLEHDAIFFFEVLTLTIQGEKNLKLCIETAAYSIDSELAYEFRKALEEVKLGKSLTESLENLRERIPSKTVGNVILNLIESNVYGTSIIDALNNQIAYITDKRILDIKAKINKMPTKISVVSVIFFIPLILLLILAPVIMTYFIK